MPAGVGEGRAEGARRQTAVVLGWGNLGVGTVGQRLLLWPWEEETKPSVCFSTFLPDDLI